VPGRPRWTRVLPWLGRTPALSRRQWRVLGLLATAELFDQYDLGILTLALLQIQAGLGIAEEQVGALISVVRLGAIPAVLAGVLADRLGRRRLLLFTVLAFTLATFATAFVQTPAQFVAVQFVTRACLYAETSLAVVVLAEELAARHRGWGLGVLGALGTMGHGVAALLFAFVEQLPFGWRALYALGALPLLAIAWRRRSLPETRRFEQRRAHAPGMASALRPVAALLRMYPGRLAVLLAAVLPFEFVVITAMTFMTKTLQQVHGWTPAGVTTLFVTGGALAILGNIAAGIASDRFGRRATVACLVALYAGAAFGFYNAAGWLVAPLWIAMIFTAEGGGVLFKALGSELFPTSYRSTASALRATTGTIGGALGLWLESQLFPVAGSHAAAISWLLPLLALPVWVAFRLPETATRELEQIAPER
jgi:putative MFS transporter